MELPKKIKDEIWDYCRVNNISNIDEFTIKLVTQGFTVEKFGATPVPREKIIEKIVEKVVEVPVEKIVERTIEVPVTMVDTEVTESLKEHIALVEKLRGELSSITDLSEQLKKDLYNCKKEKNRDIYGER